MSWYRQYRPQTIAGLHLITVRQQLDRLRESGNFPHALLFTGPKGTGKTSSARIIARLLNCEKNATVKPGTPLSEPCNECATCVSILKGQALAVVEMDAASNRRIDDIRALRERIYLPPQDGRKLVYIIDEVHMLTTEAFNALLKILEEPPEHAVFVLATTEAHKVPDTIKSRCTAVQFHKATAGELAAAMETIAVAEKLTVEPEVLISIAQQADGSFRDGVKLFEQLVDAVGKKKITIADIADHMHSLMSLPVPELVSAILAKDEQRIVAFFQSVESQGVDAHVLLKQLLEFLHQQLMMALKVEPGEPIASDKVLLFLLKAFTTVNLQELAPWPLLPLEICALEMVLKSKGQGSAGGEKSGTSGGEKPTEKSVSQQTNQRSASQVTSKVAAVIPEVKLPNEEITSQDWTPDPLPAESVGGHHPMGDVVPASIDQPAYQSVMPANGALLAEKWNELLSRIREQNVSVEALLRACRFIQGSDGKAQVQVFYQFHKEQLELQRYHTLVEQAVLETLGGLVKIEYVLSQKGQQQADRIESNISGVVENESLVSIAEDALL